MKRFFALLFAIARAADAQVPDQGNYNAALHAYVSERGVNYAGLKADRAKLDAYVAGIGTISSTQFDNWPRKQQVAYLINAYNAIVLQSVIDNYPIKRSLHPGALIRPANSVWQIAGFFSEMPHKVAGRRLTLDDIEHKLLRATFKEKRIHVALVCAARSCPPLRSAAFTADSLDDQLDDQARKFLSDRDRNLIDKSRGVVRLSQIFKWFADDFGGESGVISFVGRYLDSATQQWLQGNKYRVSYFDYDWNLNDTAAR